MFQKKSYKTSSSFHSPSNNRSRQHYMRGLPYTQYPVPILQSRDQNSKRNPFSDNQQVFRYRCKQNQGQQRETTKLQSAECKTRNSNPGLANLGRKINLNEYQQFNKCSEAQAIRNYGMNFRKKLHKQYNAKLNVYNSRVEQRKSSINHERELKNWYAERNENLHKCHLDYLKKMQTQLANNPRQQSQQIFSASNKQWEEQVCTNLKQCFDA